MSRAAIFGLCVTLLLGTAIAACGGDDDAAADADRTGGGEASALSAYGLTVEVPSDWEGRIRWPNDPDALPTMQLASFPLPDDEDPAVVAPESMPEGALWLALAEHPEVEAERRLFRGAPPVGLTWGDLGAEAVNAQLPDRLGFQGFFSTSDRAFSLHVVTSEPRDPIGLEQLNDALRSLDIDPERGERNGDARVALGEQSRAGHPNQSRAWSSSD